MKRLIAVTLATFTTIGLLSGCAQDNTEDVSRISELEAQVGSRCAQRAYCDAYVHRVEGARHAGKAGGAGVKAAMAAVQSLCLLARAYYDGTLGLLYVVGIAQEEVHLFLPAYFPHLLRESFQVVACDCCDFYHVYAFALGGGPGGGHQLPCCGQDVLMAGCPFVFYHVLSVYSLCFR